MQADTERGIEIERMWWRKRVKESCGCRVDMGAERGKEEAYK